MTNEIDDELDGILGLAVEELTKSSCKDTNSDVGMPADLNALVLAKLTAASHVVESRRDAATCNLNQTTVSSRKKIVMFAKFTVAASLFAAVVATSMFGILGGNASLYAQVAERLEGLKSLVCRVQIVDENALVDVDGNNGEKLTYLAPSLYHLSDEWLMTIEIYNGVTGDFLMLDAGSQEAIVTSGHVVDTRPVVSPVRLIEAVRNHFRSNRKDQADVKDLGTRSIDGKQAFGMRSAISGEIVEAWFDPKSYLPVLVRVQNEIPAELTGGTKDKMWQVMSDFEFDVPVDHALFSMTIPDGYRLLEKDDPLANVSPATLEDVLRMLRICAKANDSQFPLSLAISEEEGSPLGLQRKFVEEIESQFHEDDDATRAAVLNAESEFLATVIRGMVFFLNMKDANKFRYFGGARLNEANRPLLWYSPDGDNRFKIVYADLTVLDADATALPPEPTPVAVLKNDVDEDAIDVSTPTFELPSAITNSCRRSERLGRRKKYAIFRSV
jgi:ribosomal protein S15P/S13E